MCKKLNRWDIAYKVYKNCSEINEEDKANLLLIIKRENPILEKMIKVNQA